MSSLKPILLVFCLYAWIGQVNAFSCAGTDWSTNNSILEGLHVATAVIDFNQTKKFTSPPYVDDFSETWGRAIIGQYPSPRRLLWTLTGRILGHAIISYCLEPKKRHYWQGLTSVLSLSAIINNHNNLGIKLRFKLRLK